MEVDQIGENKMNVLRKPWHVSLVIFAIWELVIMKIELLPFIVHHTTQLQLEQFDKNYIDTVRPVAIAFFWGTITYLNWWSQVGLKGLDTQQIKAYLKIELRNFNRRLKSILELKSRNFHFLWPPTSELQGFSLLWPPALVILFLLLFVFFTGLPPIRIIIVLIINTLMIGISEELMFRGILFYGASSSFGIWRAVWITTIIFGVDHVLNGFITGDFNASIIQAFSACMFGFSMVALRVRLDTIIPGIIFHWVWDFLTYLTNPIGNMLMFNVELLLFYYGIWLLRNYLPKRFRYKEASKSV